MHLVAPFVALGSVAVAALVAGSSALHLRRATRSVEAGSPDVPAATRRLGRQADRLGGAVGRHLGR